MKSTPPVHPLMRPAGPITYDKFYNPFHAEYLPADIASRATAAGFFGRAQKPGPNADPPFLKAAFSEDLKTRIKWRPGLLIHETGDESHGLWCG